MKSSLRGLTDDFSRDMSGASQVKTTVFPIDSYSSTLPSLHPVHFVSHHYLSIKNLLSTLQHNQTHESQPFLRPGKCHCLVACSLSAFSLSIFFISFYAPYSNRFSSTRFPLFLFSNRSPSQKEALLWPLLLLLLLLLGQCLLSQE